MMSLNKRLDLIEPKILEKSFRTGRGTANEVNFWIFDYDSEDEMAVRAHVDFLVGRVNGRSEDARIACFDLYGLMLEVLRDKGYLSAIPEMQKNMDNDSLIDALRGAFSVEVNYDLIIQKITDGIQSETDIVFLVGVGKAWPVIRSHTILNNLHSIIIQNPLVLFFPGDYTGELRLFGEITDDNYYRAFKLIER